MFSRETYKERRRVLSAAMGKGLILLLGNSESGMNYKDNVYPFRQDSSFLYFFGLDKPGLAGVINVDEDTEMIVGDEATLDDIVWTGPQTSLSEAAEKAGIKKVIGTDKLPDIIKQSIATGQTVHYLPPYRPENLLWLSVLLNRPVAAVKDDASIQLIKAVVAQRAIKSPEEEAEINKAVNISNEMHLAAMRESVAGVTEKYVSGKLEGMSVSAGGRLSYPVIYTINGQILHNHPTDAVLKSGQIVLCDAGAETAMHYAGDLTRSYPVDKKFTSLQKEAYEIVLRAQEEAVNALKPGALFYDIHHLACEWLVKGLQQLGLMKGDVKEAVQQGAHTLFFQCGLGHMMGLDVHDMEDLGEQYVGYADGQQKSKEFGLKSLRLARKLEPGFVLTVEPGLYFISELMDIWESQKKFSQFINYDKLAPFRSFGGVRVEENFIITEQGYRLLGDPLIKTVAEIEQYRG
ncbi:MAG TPA: aminopeptidase P family protein [Chitinophagaceae bacterium]|nr:aminopeptidase P family protein [Chitinophagaceae bacterium]